MNRHTPADRADTDIRVVLISRIWAYATGMLAIAMLVTPSYRRSIALPIAIPSAAAISTIVIWSVPARQMRLSREDRSVQQLEQRIADLEAIASNDNLAWQSRLPTPADRRLDQTDS